MYSENKKALSDYFSSTEDYKTAAKDANDFLEGSYKKTLNDAQTQENLVEAVNHFEDFYEEVFTELAKFGELEEMVVADNIGEHMIGNVYVKYQSED